VPPLSVSQTETTKVLSQHSSVRSYRYGYDHMANIAYGGKKFAWLWICDRGGTKSSTVSAVQEVECTKFCRARVWLVEAVVGACNANYAAGYGTMLW